jgi:hypothetical protein
VTESVTWKNKKRTPGYVDGEMGRNGEVETL